MTRTETALGLLRANAPERPVRLLGVRVGGFRDSEERASGRSAVLSLLAES